MLHLRSFLCLYLLGITLFLRYGIVSGAKDPEYDDFTTLRSFHQSITNIPSFNPVDALKHLHTLHDKTLLDIPISNEIPVLHHLLNLYFQAPSVAPSHSSTIRAYLIDIMLKCISYGIDVDQEFRNDPSTLFKAVLLREMDLASKISSFSLSKVGINIATQLIQLYGIPCEAVPMAKLLLHADTLIRGKATSLSSKQEVDMDWVLKLLLNASPGVGSKPSTKIIDMVRYSSTFNTSILSTLGTGSRYAGILLTDIISSLTETAASTHLNILTSISSADSIAIWQTILSYHDVSHRNIFHHVAVAGAVSMISQLTLALQDIIIIDPTMVTLLEVALLDIKDHHDLLPYQYVIIRHGTNSSVYHAVNQLYQLVGYDFQSRSISMDTKKNAMKPHESSCDNDNDMKVCVDSNISSDNVSRVGSGGWDDTRIIYPTPTAHDHKHDSITPSNPASMLDSSSCDIIERWDGHLPSAEEFYRDYVITSTPVIFRQVNNVSHPILQAFQKVSFLARYGSDVVPISHIPYAGSFGMASTTATLAQVANITIIDFYKASPSYAFTVAQNTWRQKLQDDIPLPSCIATLEIQGRKISEAAGSVETQFYLGGAGTGAPVHFHGHAVNSLAYGEKKWFLYPVYDAYYSTIAANEFVLHDPHAMQARTCTQYAGDVMFVPALWGHGTFNMKQSIGVAHEFSVEPFCSE